MYNWITTLYIWNPHNIVNQLHPNKTKKEKKRKATAFSSSGKIPSFNFGSLSFSLQISELFCFLLSPPTFLHHYQRFLSHWLLSHMLWTAPILRMLGKFSLDLTIPLALPILIFSTKLLLNKLSTVSACVCSLSYCSLMSAPHVSAESPPSCRLWHINHPPTPAAPELLSFMDCRTLTSEALYFSPLTHVFVLFPLSHHPT